MSTRRQKIHDRHILLHWANILAGEPRNNVNFDPNTRAGYYFRVLKDAIQARKLKTEYLDVARYRTALIARVELIAYFKTTSDRPRALFPSKRAGGPQRPHAKHEDVRKFLETLFELDPPPKRDEVQRLTREHFAALNRSCPDELIRRAKRDIPVGKKPTRGRRQTALRTEN